METPTSETPVPVTFPKNRAKIDVEICLTCFATIPANQVVVHGKWHEDHPTKEGVLV